MTSKTTTKQTNKDSETYDLNDSGDNILIRLADMASPLFRKMNYTSNGIITLSLIFSLASFYYLAKRDMTKFMIYYTLGYFFDILGIHYSRKYKFSKKQIHQSDRYNNIKNIGLVILFAYILYDQYNVTDYPVLLIILLCLLVLIMIGSKCKMDSYSIEAQSESCRNYLNIMRRCGRISIHFMVVLIVWYLNYQYKANIQKNTLYLITN